MGSPPPSRSSSSSSSLRFRSSASAAPSLSRRSTDGRRQLPRRNPPLAPQEGAMEDSVATRDRLGVVRLCDPAPLLRRVGVPQPHGNADRIQSPLPYRGP